MVAMNQARTASSPLALVTRSIWTGRWRPWMVACEIAPALAGSMSKETSSQGQKA